MAGYDKSRIVDVKEEDLEEYTCGICLNVLNEPVVVQCCRQTYCKDCIDEWLARGNTCPNDRQILMEHDLSPAPRLVINVLKNMKIKCERHSEGCESVVTIAQLEAHTESCPFFKCPKCGTKDPDADHDCVKHLLRTVDELKEQVEDLTKTSQGIADGNYTKKYIKSAIESSRQNLHGFEIKARRGKVVETDIAVEFSVICKRAITAENSLNNICAHIRREINDKYSEGGRYTWQVIVLACNADGGGQSSFSVLHVNILTMLFHRLEITIFSPPRSKTK